VQLKPILLHFLQKFFGNRIAAVFTNNGIDPAIRTKRSAGRVLDPALDLLRVKYFQTGKASAFSIFQ